MAPSFNSTGQTTGVSLDALGGPAGVVAGGASGAAAGAATGVGEAATGAGVGFADGGVADPTRGIGTTFGATAGVGMEWIGAAGATLSDAPTPPGLLPVLHNRQKAQAANSTATSPAAAKIRVRREVRACGAGCMPVEVESWRGRFLSVWLARLRASLMRLIIRCALPIRAWRGGPC
jgi:hypothetical protein